MNRFDTIALLAGGLAVLVLVVRSTRQEAAQRQTFKRVGNQVVLPAINIEKDVYINTPIFNPKTGAVYQPF